MFVKSIIIGILVGIAVGVSGFFVYKKINEPRISITVVTPMDTPTSTVAEPSISPTPAEPIQYVLLSFDGSYDMDMWNDTLAFAQDMRQQDIPVNFTYFVSGVYFIPYARRMLYVSPEGRGISRIGFSGGTKDVQRHVQIMERVFSDGHALGSHANGHFDGSQWTLQQWISEMDQFKTFVTDAQSAESNLYSNMSGFRAPLLATNQNMYAVLKSEHYTYDVSIATAHPMNPYRLENGIWEFPLPHIPYNGDARRSLIAMDYNFYYRQTGGKDLYIKDTPEWNRAYQETLNSYMDYFNAQYNGMRIPVEMSNHFSLWNDGLYWNVMKQFAFQVCGKPHVQCISYPELVNKLNSDTMGQAGNAY